jgi:hypothetical protein
VLQVTYEHNCENPILDTISFLEAEVDEIAEEKDSPEI